MPELTNATDAEFTDYLLKLVKENSSIKMPDNIVFTGEQYKIICGIMYIKLVGNNASFDSGIKRMENVFNKNLKDFKFTGKGSGGRKIEIPEKKKYEMYLAVETLHREKEISFKEACEEIGFNHNTYKAYKRKLRQKNKLPSYKK